MINSIAVQAKELVSGLSSAWQAWRDGVAQSRESSQGKTTGLLALVLSASCSASAYQAVSGEQDSAADQTPDSSLMERYDAKLEKGKNVPSDAGDPGSSERPLHDGSIDSAARQDRDAGIPDASPRYDGSTPDAFIGDPIEVDCPLPAIPIDIDWSRGHEGLFAREAMPVYEVIINEAEWEQLCRETIAAVEETSPYSSQFDAPYARAQVRISGRDIPVEVGLRFRGRSSILDGIENVEDCIARAFSNKPNFRISVNAFSPGSRFLDMKKFNLIGRNAGSTIGIDEILFSHVARFLGIPHPRMNHALLCLNGRYMGVYLHAEEPDDQPFLDHYFEQPEGEYYKCDGQCKLTFADLSEDSYQRRYEPKAGTVSMQPLLDFLREANNPSRDEFRRWAEAHLQTDHWLYPLAMELFFMDHDGLFTRFNNALLYASPSDAADPAARQWSMVRFDTDALYATDEPADWDSAARGPRMLCWGRNIRDGLNNPDGTVARASNPAYTIDQVSYAVLLARLAWDSHRDRYREVSRNVADAVASEYETFIEERLAALLPWVGGRDDPPERRDPFLPFGYGYLESQTVRFRDRVTEQLGHWREDVERDDFATVICPDPSLFEEP